MEKTVIRVGSDFCGVGAFNQALKRLNLDYKESFACDFNYYARMTFIANYGTDEDLEIAKLPEHKKFADEMEKIALGESKLSESEILEFRKKANDFCKLFSFYYPFDVYDREVPGESLDVYMTSPPCQSFSLAGKRKGEDSVKGVLFYNSHEFIKKNKPRFFIFENVKGLLSDDGGKTFQRWIDYLGGKSVNGSIPFFPHEESVPYHIYYQVLNAKNYEVPQNRERIFIIGIRDDEDNKFNFPKEVPLLKRLKDVLEENVDEKYYLKDSMVEGFIGLNIEGIGKTIRCGGGSTATEKHNFDLIKVGYVNQDTQASQVYASDGLGQTLCAGTHGYANGYVEVKSATTKGFEIAKIGEDSINFEHPNSETRRGRVGVGQTLATSCNQGVAEYSILGYTRDSKGKVVSRHEKNIAGTLHTSSGSGGNTDQFVKIGAIRGRNSENPNSRESGLPTQQMLEINENGTSNCLTTVQKDNVVVIGNLPGKHEQNSRIYGTNGVSPTLTTMQGGGQEPKISKDYRIRKLTPIECFRLMNFPDSLVENARKKVNMSDSQLYKQAGNSIVVNKLCKLLIRLLS